MLGVCLREERDVWLAIEALRGIATVGSEREREREELSVLKREWRAARWYG